MDELIEAHPDRVRVVFKRFLRAYPPASEPAARASVAAQNQGKCWEYRALLFEYQRRLETEGIFEELAEQAGLDMAQFDADIEDPEVEEQMNRDRLLGESVGVRGTPHYFINGNSLPGAVQVDAFREAIDRELPE